MSNKGDFVGRDNGPIALVLGNREQRKVLSFREQGTKEGPKYREQRKV